MRVSLRILTLVLAQFVAVCAFTQATNHDPIRSHDPLATSLPSCGGAWEAIQRASAEVDILNVPMTRHVREQILCLLDGINKTKFKEDSTYDNLMAFEFTRLVVMAYGKSGLDFFAEQLTQQPERVRRGLSTSLLEHGHPVAVRQYFEFRRAKLAAGETWDRESSVGVGIFRSFLEDGKCSAGLCSEHSAETLAIIQANLDIIDMELEAVESSFRSLLLALGQAVALCAFAQSTDPRAGRTHSAASVHAR